MWLYTLTLYTNNILSVLNFTENFFWRSMISYLNHMYFSLIFISLYILAKYKYNILLVYNLLLLTYKLYFLELINFNLLKSVFLMNNLHKFFFELLIGLVSIHPIMFYWGLSLFTLMYLTMYNKNNYTFIVPSKNLAILITALVLGGVWGWLNFAWGYIWVYDFIEYFLLWLIVLTLYYLHTKIYKMNLKNTVWLINLMMLYYITLRYGFLPTRHSFFNKISLNTIKQTTYYLLIINNVGLYVNVWLFTIISFVKIWSILIVYIICFISIKNLHIKNTINYISIYLIHIIVFLLIFTFVLHTPNYIFYIIDKTYINKKQLIVQNLLSNNYKNLISIKLNNKKLIRVFKSNNFFNINQNFLQVYNTTQVYLQTSSDIYYFFLTLIFICLLLYKKW